MSAADSPVPSPRVVRRIVVGTALDPSSNDVVGAAAALAKALDAQLTVVHASSPPPISLWLPASEPDWLTEVERMQRQRVVEQVRSMGLHEVQIRVDSGLPDFVIIDAAQELDADLVVVGAVTASNKAAKLLGSTAEHVVRESDRPVLVIRQPLKLPLRRVLAPVDLSPASADAFRCGMRMLAPLSETEPFEVEVLFVLTPEHGRHARGAEADKLVAMANEELQGLVEATELPGAVTITWRVVQGEPRRQILEEMESGGYDLAVVGTRGEGGLRRIFGSTTRALVHGAAGNLLLIPPGPALDTAIGEAIESQTAP